MYYSKKENILICSLAIILILLFFVNTVVNVLQTVEIVNINTSSFFWYNPSYVLCYILTASLIILFIATINRFIKEHKYKSRKRIFFYINSFIFFIVYIILFFPNYIPFYNINIWIAVDFFGGIYTIFYLMHIFTLDKSISVK